MGLTCLLLPVAAFGIAESLGWPFLAVPLQSFLQNKLGRTVRLFPPENSDAPVQGGFHVQLWNGIRLQTQYLEIGSPDWSTAPYLVKAHDVKLALRYLDLWHAYRGQQLHVKSLQANHLDGFLTRRADGRATWQLAANGPAPPMPVFQELALTEGHLHVSDAPKAIDLNVQLSLANSATTPSPTPERHGHRDQVLQLTAMGHYQRDPLQISLTATGELPSAPSAEQGAAPDTPIAVTIKVQIARANLSFHGTALEFLHLNGLEGRFTVSGPSLAAVGAPFGVTLPTTHDFQAEGRLRKQNKVWHVEVASAKVGTSQLAGDFLFHTETLVPKLTGKLTGPLLMLVDLGPAVGAVKVSAVAAPAKVLPTRPFNLAALRNMDADVLIDIRSVDLNTPKLEPLRPLRAHLLLEDGLLTLRDLDARTAQGHLGGTLTLDGRHAQARWTATLQWDGVRLEQWIHLARSAGAPPYLSGKLKGDAALQGQGRSTADILATLQGQVRTTIEEGALSHLLIEMSGLDVAESLGVWFAGDKALPLQCAVVDLEVGAGVLRPRMVVLDTSDSTLWVNGSLSLASETMDLRVVVAPKDFSPLALRSPLQVRGSFTHPVVSISKGSVGAKLAGALLLSLINPLATLIPLVDAGNTEAAKIGAAGCLARMHQKLPARLMPRPSAQVPKSG